MTTDVENGLNDSIFSILSRYNDGTEINSVVFNNLSNYGVEQDVIDALQLNSNNTSYWDKYYVAEPNQYVGDALSGFILDTSSTALSAQKNLSLTITNSVKLLTTTTVSVERAVIDYFEGLPVKAYVEKATGKIITSETVFSETTHIPYGKYLAGAAKGIEAYAIYETFKDTVISAYEATTGQGDTFTPLKNYLIAGTAVIVGAAATVAAAPVVGTGILAIGAGSIAASGAAWAADTLINNLQDFVDQAKAAGKTQEETLTEVQQLIDDTVEEYWNLTGEDAVSAQEQGQALLESLIDDVGEALPNIDIDQNDIQNSQSYDVAESDKIVITSDEEKILVNEEGEILSSIFDPAEQKMINFDLRIADFEANGTVLSQTTGTTTLYGETFNFTETVRELNGEQQKIVVFELPASATNPSNGVQAQIFVYEQDGGVTFM